MTRRRIPDPLEPIVSRGLEAAARSHGIWQDSFSGGVGFMAEIIANYVRLAMADGTDPTLLTEMRVEVRTILHSWYFIDAVETTEPLRLGKIDCDAWRLCGFGPSEVPPNRPRARGRTAPGGVAA